MFRPLLGQHGPEDDLIKVETIFIVFKIKCCVTD